MTTSAPAERTGRKAITLARPAAPAPSAGTSAADAVYCKLFDSFNPDKDGRISQWEVLTRLQRFGLQPDDPRITGALAGTPASGPVTAPGCARAG